MARVLVLIQSFSWHYPFLGIGFDSNLLSSGIELFHASPIQATKTRGRQDG